MDFPEYVNAISNDTHEAGAALIGDSASMSELRRLIARVGANESAALIVGESGSGKALVAEAIHAASARRKGPLVAVNCAAIPSSMVEIELFGFNSGMDGALDAHPGAFERAQGGTIFLDEITEMPAEMQACLLRVLESKRLTRVGSDIEIPIDVRIIAATNRNPRQAFQEGHLREDIFYRLAVFPICVPPLRERGDDVQLLIDHFLHQLNERYRANKRVSPELRSQFQSHDWPGNVRELANAMERAFILADDWLMPTALELTISGHNNAHQEGHDAVALPVGTKLAYAERLLIEFTLRHYQGNRQRTAAVLGCSLKTLYNKLQAYRAGVANGESM